MVINRFHLSITLIIAIVIHGVFILFFSLPKTDAQEFLEPKREDPIRISLLSMIAEEQKKAQMKTAEAIVADVPEPPEIEKKIIKKPELISKQIIEAKPEVVVEKEVKQAPELAKALEPALVQAPTVPEPTIQKPETQKPALPKTAPSKIERVLISTAEIVKESEPTPQPLNAVATAQYEQVLVAWLEKHKKYPRRAKRLRIEGEAMLRIRIDRAGVVLQFSLEKPTGHRFLDKATLAMAERSSPFPPMPENDPRKTLEFRVPVLFALN